VTGARAIANLGLGWLAHRGASVQLGKGHPLEIMSFGQIAYIWLAVLFAAFVSGSVAGILDARTHN
jgi:hypothetical protein